MIWKLIFSALWSFVKPVLLQLVKLVSKEVLENVMHTVTALAETDLTNEEKRNEAFYQIKEHLKAEGKELSDSIINLLIETAVSKLKLK